jgi:alkylhydroperoxidase family enzyme
VETVTPARQPRLKNPAAVIPGAWQAVRALHAATAKAGVPPATLAPARLRASQIHGRSACLDSGTRSAKAAGEPGERLSAVAACPDSPHVTGPERSALALAEAVTRLADRPDPVPGGIWDEAARHYDKAGPAALVRAIATTNVFHRLNVTTRQLAGDWR